MPVAVLRLSLHLPGCNSLKEKRGRLLPLINRMRREFNVSVTEIAEQDTWQTAVLACAMVNTDASHLDRSFRHLVHWVETNWPDLEVEEDQIEFC